MEQESVNDYLQKWLVYNLRIHGPAQGIKLRIELKHLILQAFCDIVRTLRRSPSNNKGSTQVGPFAFISGGLYHPFEVLLLIDEW